jgi:hypothetical protein
MHGSKASRRISGGDLSSAFSQLRLDKRDESQGPAGTCFPDPPRSAAVLGNAGANKQTPNGSGIFRSFQRPSRMRGVYRAGARHWRVWLMSKVAPRPATGARLSRPQQCPNLKTHRRSPRTIFPGGRLMAAPRPSRCRRHARKLARYEVSGNAAQRNPS